MYLQIDFTSLPVGHDNFIVSGNQFVEINFSVCRDTRAAIIIDNFRFSVTPNIAIGGEVRDR